MLQEPAKRAKRPERKVPARDGSARQTETSAPAAGRVIRFPRDREALESLPLLDQISAEATEDPGIGGWSGGFANQAHWDPTRARDWRCWAQSGPTWSAHCGEEVAANDPLGLCEHHRRLLFEERVLEEGSSGQAWPEARLAAERLFGRALSGEASGLEEASGISEAPGREEASGIAEASGTPVASSEVADEEGPGPEAALSAG